MSDETQAQAQQAAQSASNNLASAVQIFNHSAIELRKWALDIACRFGLSPDDAIALAERVHQWTTKGGDAQ